MEGVSSAAVCLYRLREMCARARVCVCACACVSAESTETRL